MILFKHTKAKSLNEAQSSQAPCLNNIVLPWAIFLSRKGIKCDVSLLPALKSAIQILDFGGHLVLKLHNDFLEHSESKAKVFGIS